MGAIPAGLEVVLDVGFEVLPCRDVYQDDAHKDKEPLTPHGKNDASADREQIREWTQQHPGCAWGARPPTTATVLDIDTKHGIDGFATLRALEAQHGPLPRTKTNITTTRGEHRIFQTDGTVFKNAVSALPGLDVRSNRGYILVPPSAIVTRDCRERRAYRWADPHQPVVRAPEWLVREIFSKDPDRQALTSGSLPQGRRNETLFRYACLLRAKNLPKADARPMLLLRNQRDCSPPLTSAEVEECLENAYKYDAGFNLTELGNAQRLMAAHGEDWRWLPELGWVQFDGVRWATDRQKGIGLVAADVARALWIEALSEPGEVRRRELRNWAQKSEARRVIEAATALAQPYAADLLERYDRAPYLVATQTGVLDLESGVFREGRREDRLRLAASVTFDAAAEAPLWRAFLVTIFGADEAMIGFVQRAAGYSMIGDNPEQVLFIAHGSGNNGKTKFINVLRRILGDYAKAVQPETLMSRDRSGIPNDIARLAGVRFVSSAEVEEGKKLYESLIKQMTGGDSVSARFLHKEFFDFVPMIKLWIITNHKPVISGTDAAIWRRVLLLPFEVTIPPERRDKHLEEKLMAEAPGIFNWMRAGFEEWRRAGLAAPEKVVAATAAYREEMDRIGAFLQECCLVNTTASTKKSVLYAAYKTWSEAGGYVAMGRKRFFDRLRDDHQLTPGSRDGYEVFRLLLVDTNAL